MSCSFCKLRGVGVVMVQMFEMDSYVGVDVLGLTFMRGEQVSGPST